VQIHANRTCEHLHSIQVRIQYAVSVALLRGRGGKKGRTTPGDTILGDTQIKLFLWLNLERTLDKRSGKMGVEKTTAKKCWWQK